MPVVFIIVVFPSAQMLTLNRHLKRLYLELPPRTVFLLEG